MKLLSLTSGRKIGAIRDFHFLVDWSHFFIHKPQIDLNFLEIPFSLEESKKATFNLRVDKALGPDGFPMAFFQKHWDTIYPDLLHPCHDIFDGKANLECINWANIVLIPKKNGMTTIRDSHPISLINALLKIISKILATQLSSVIDSLVN